MTAPDSLHQLVEKFDRDKERFTDPDYNEAQLREEFVNPFFRALGWDLGEQVLHEAGLRSGGTVKHPDYTFLAGSRRAFYVETKKPSINIGNSVEPAEQLRSYGWSGDTALGILTNFAEFAVYDCRVEPVQGDLPDEARVMYLTSSQYLDEWDWLRETLSPEAVRQGKHGDILETTAKGVLRVDEAFLRDMETWRVDLAPDIYKQARFIGRTLSQRELNHLVQRTIDRIVFLRIAEDRNLESYGRLERAASVRRNSYNEIKTLYIAADRKYNSGLFHFDPKDKSRPDADTLSLDIRIGDGILRKIIADLYPPKSRYQFSVISADILGQVYERFLGKVIEVRVVDEKTKVTVEEKPEVRKAGGVYYTPAYIVDYIVENTVGALLKDKTPAQVADLRVLDPACGSGSFLVGAYQYLLDWHLAYYRRHPKQFRNRRRETTAGMILTTVEKRRILLNNIYGVDLDQNAVEVSKLSLLLKMLENENDATGMSDMTEPMLPDLSGNIKWGNSLIGSDFFSPEDLAARDDEELLRVKPFDWDSKAGFGEIMAAGGFDAVIGNPPYVILGTDVIESAEIEYLREYQVAQYKTDLYHLFLERGIQILRSNGILGFITPNPWLTQKFTNQLREYILQNTRIEELAVFDHLVFADANVYTSVIFLQKRTDNETHQIRVKHPKDANSLAAILETSSEGVGQTSWLNNDNYVFETRLIGKIGDFVSRVLQNNPSLGNVARASLGCQAYNRTKHTKEQIKNRVFHANERLSDEYLPELAGSDVGRYIVERKRGTWIKYGAWLHDYRAMDWLKGPRILIREIPGKPPYKIQACYLEETYCNYKTILNVNPSEITKFDMKYLTGLLNSKLLSFVYPFMSNKLVSRSFPRLSVGDLRKLPIRAIDLDNPADVQMHDDMVKLVDEMLDLHKQLAGLSLVKRGVIEALIERTDREIDALVYRLYGLSDDEVAVVEGE